MIGFDRFPRWAVAMTVVIGAAGAGTAIWVNERSSFERSVRAADIVDPLPADSEYAAEVLAARVAVRYCDDVAVQSHFDVDEFTGGDSTRVYVPECLPQPERTEEELDMSGVRTYVLGGSIPQMVLDREARCLAVPGGNVRHLIAYTGPGEGIRCPTPGCPCRVPEPGASRDGALGLDRDGAR